MDAYIQRIFKRIDILRPELINLSQKIHAHPEVAFEEKMASSWLSEFLASEGFEVEKGIGGLQTAFTAKMRGKGPGPTVAFLAEYDALPEIGHGCGHNLIGTGAAGAATGVAAAMKDLSGSIQVIGTPAEEYTEGLAGKLLLLEGGIFDGIDVCLMFHPWTETAVPMQDFGFMVFDVNFHGLPAHAAADPWNGLNALDAVVIAYNNLSALRQQIRPDARIHFIITNGGDAVNVIPHETSGRIMFRSTQPQQLEELAERIEACIQGAALATGTSVDVNTVSHVKPSKFNESLFEIVRGGMQMLGGALQRIDLWGASSDFGNVSHVIPSLYMLMKTHEPNINWHSIHVAEGAISEEAHDAMVLAAKALAISAVEILVNSDSLERINKDFLQRI